MAKTLNQSSSMEQILGRDEMNLVEFPLGPLGKTNKKTLKIDHVVYDKIAKRNVNRQVTITGTDEYGLPKAVDDKVLMGMFTLTHEAGYESRKVFFSGSRLCKILGWSIDGHAFKRIEESLDRLQGTSLKFKNSWYDNSEKEWRSHSFHLIESYELCSRDRYNNVRRKGGGAKQELCCFVWSEVIWKSFKDNYIKKVDMKMFRRIANGRRREAPLRLFRWLDKKLYKKRTKMTVDLMNLCNGIIGYSLSYPCHAKRAITKAADILVEADFLECYTFRKTQRGYQVTFHKKKRAKKNSGLEPSVATHDASFEKAEIQEWIQQYSEQDLFDLESEALQAKFGGTMYHRIIHEQRSDSIPVYRASLIRQMYIRNYVTSVVANDASE